MPKQNRANPFGEIMAIADRGTFMGNRGILHDSAGRIRRAWQVKRWLVCVLEFRGRRRQVMTPGRYTELFFLDEATALAAGHRPCAECRHRRFIDFCQAWARAHPRRRFSPRPTADQIDAQLHAERVGPDRSKACYVARLDELPDGAIVALGDQPCLIWREHLLVWSPRGYGRRQRRTSIEVRVLTPKSAVATIRAGYIPEVHPSAYPPASADFVSENDPLRPLALGSESA